MTQDNIYGAAIIVGFILIVVYVVLKERQTGNMVKALTNIAIEAQNNNRALDLAESLAIKVIPADSPTRARVNKFVEWLETLTPEEGDIALEAWRGLFNKATDGLPNEAPAPLTFSETQQAVSNAIANTMGKG